MCKKSTICIMLSSIKSTTENEQGRYIVFLISVYVSMKNLWGKALMLIFAFTQTFLSPIYKFDSKILLLPQKYGLAYVWKTEYLLHPLCSDTVGRKISLHCLDELLLTQTRTITTPSKKLILTLYKECKAPTEVKKILIHVSGSRIQLSELKQLALTCCFNSEMRFQLTTCINHDLRAMCFIKKTVFQSQSAIQMESPQK